MPYLGRYQLGIDLPVVLRCTRNGQPDVPASHPTAEVRADADPAAIVYSGRVPAADQGAVRGLFKGGVRVGDDFAAGPYHLILRWQDSAGEDRCEARPFDVIPGGAASGPVISLAAVDRPHVSYLIRQTDDGTLARGANPRLVPPSGPVSPPPPPATYPYPAVI